MTTLTASERSHAVSLDKRIARLRVVYRKPEVPIHEHGRAGRLTMREEFELYELLTKIAERIGLTVTERARCDDLCSRWENRPTTC